MNLLGKLDWNEIPLHEPFIMGATRPITALAAIAASTA